jgi:hypothetical protein
MENMGKKRSTEREFDLVSSGLSHLIPKGGIKHPDSMVTKGSNRSLYLPGSGFVSPVPGARPTMGKQLLTGTGRLRKKTDGLDQFRKLR